MKGRFMSHFNGSDWMTRFSCGLACLLAFSTLARAERASAIFVATPDGIVRSLNGGKGWESVGDGIGGVSAVVASASNSAMLYAVAQAAVYRSSDLGSTWVSVLSNVNVTRIAVSPTDANVVYVLEKRRLWRSVDGANTWSSFETPDLLSVEPDRYRIDVLYGIGRADRSGSFPPEEVQWFNVFYRSDDRGQTWSPAAQAPWLHPTTVLSDPIAPDHLYVNSFDALLESGDAGQSWLVFADAGLVLGPPPPDVLGVIWRGFDATSAIIADPLRFGDVYACITEEADFVPGSIFGIYDRNWFVARVSGSWKRLSQPPGGCRALARDSNSDRIIYAASAMGLFELDVIEGDEWLRIGGDRLQSVNAVISFPIDCSEGTNR
jgi:hypothetical protein